MQQKIYCNNCKKSKFDKLFSLGNLFYTGKFGKYKNSKIRRGIISLIKCKNCNLVQLDRKFDPKYLYGKDYGYRSGINQTMKNHLNEISSKLSKLVKLKDKDQVLDIASNDGTLLNSYSNSKIIKIGIDPTINKFLKFYEKVDYKISDFFSYKSYQKLKFKKKNIIITACAVFYDLNDPNKFLADVSKILDQKRGIFYLEFQDLLSIIKNLLFDTICHEHLEYYSLSVVIKMLKKNNLKLLDVNKNDINGGSLSLTISHIKSNYKENTYNIKRLITEEKKYKLESKKTFDTFYKKILILKKKLNDTIKKLHDRGKVIHGYGASTKGNVLLQFFNLNNKLIKFIADRNIKKNNLYTPGTKIKIVTEKISRNLKPDYYLVLPWHFKNEILKREMPIRNKGTKFIFPLPNLRIL
jgi:hypothetical protein